MKKLLSVIIILCTFMTFTSLSNASGMDDSDTFSFSQQKYEENLNRFLMNSSDEEIIHKTIETFLFVSHASSRDSMKYNVSFLIDPDYLMSNNIQYRINQNKCIEKLYEVQNSKIPSDSLILSDYSVKINDNTAIASIKEDYTYYDSIIGKDSSYGRQFEFILSHKDERWLIQVIKTTDPWELQENFEYDIIDVDEVIKQILTPSAASIDAEKKEQKLSGLINEAKTLYKWDYNASIAKQYAEAHYNDYSDDYFSYSSTENCQNFASQCVWAGLGGSLSNLTSYPVVYDSTYGSSNDRLWQNYNYYVNGSIDYRMQWAWDNVNGFARLIHDSSIYEEGPYGWLHWNTLNYAEVGDVIWIEYSGDPYYTSTYVNLDHAMVVLEVDGTASSRDIIDITEIAAHTLHSYTEESLSAYLARLCNQADSSYFAVARIRGAYYSSSQP